MRALAAVLEALLQNCNQQPLRGAADWPARISHGADAQTMGCAMLANTAHDRTLAAAAAVLNPDTRCVDSGGQQQTQSSLLMYPRLQDLVQPSKCAVVPSPSSMSKLHKSGYGRHAKHNRRKANWAHLRTHARNAGAAGSS